MRLFWQQRSDTEGQDYSKHSAEAWTRFYEAPPHQEANAIVAAFEFLLQEIEQGVAESDLRPEAADAVATSADIEAREE